MKGRTTLALLAVFVGLAVYVYLGELRRPAEPAATPTPAALWNATADQVVGLTVRGGERETRLARPAGGEWALEAPVAEPADQGRVTQLVERLAGVAPSRTFTQSLQPLEDYGLAKPSLEVALRLADGRTETLQIGVADPLQTDYYGRVQGAEAVHLVPGWLVTSLQEILASPPVQPTPTPTSAATATPEVTPAPTATPGG